MEEISIHQRIEITEMLDLAIEIKKVSDSMADSGHSDYGDIQYLEEAGERLQELKDKYTIPK